MPPAAELGFTLGPEQPLRTCVLSCLCEHLSSSNGVTVQEVEIIGTFESEETARVVAKALNAFFTWLMEGDREAEVPEFFGDFGVTTEDYVIDKDDIDWPEAPRARVRGPKIAISAETSQTIDTLAELTEALGAFDVCQVDDEDDGDD